MKALHLIFSGKVQGVGFRWAAKDIAEQHDVVGTVKNLPSGDVEMIVQGQSKDVEGFLKALNERFHKHIEHIKEELILPDPSITLFTIATN